ncbi:uncharacterized protein TNCV_1441411 [Trichonephila clavipes]|uniref:Uncharacterized protein n=1 Tax=Trichonephila clavipes TaxID=2585209 RepID=A0A8X6V683_TRICX|nr:uncharacterized protein TNCV_1441411 [Trichonephila clavipes]
MEQSNKNITNADALTSERERNLAKENGETQQANIKDENMQDLDDQQPSEKDIVQPEDISNAPSEKCLKNVGFELEKYVDVGKDTEYYHNVLKRVILLVKYLAIRVLAFRGTEEVFGSPHNGVFYGCPGTAGRVRPIHS